jgi:acyl-CoA synthetase (AMP-forming)/AMP-acid ligase II
MSAAKTLDQFMNDPMAYFDNSITKMHTIPRDELEALQRQAMSLRFSQHRESIEILRNLADRLDIKEVKDFDDLTPLFFAHTAFKSYPASLLDNKRFDLMTKWLNKLTSHDISHVDTTGCDSIDEWIDRLDEQTPLELITSSGTTGTLSLIPKDKHGAMYTMKLWRMFLFQTFGKEPTPDELNPEVEVIWPNYASGKLGHLRMAAMIKREFTGGDESKFHALYSDAISTDLMFLASKLRAAASRGELDRVEIDPKLLARKEEFEAMQARRPQEMSEFFERVSRELAGKRVFMTSAYSLMYELAAAGLERGLRNVFAPNSAILTGGGTKGMVLPDNYMEIIQEFLGVDRIQEGYGMSEISAFHWACDEGRYHVQPWVIPFLLDPDTSEPLPREGRQTGRAAFYDFFNQSHWGGIISGDEITIDWSTPCACGLASVPIEHDIIRYSEKQGVEDDRITCSATQQVNDEAIDFMRELES